MRITVLAEDTGEREDLCAEHGFSLYIEANGRTVVMDTGLSPATVKNAEALGKDIAKADAIVISHGHYDHTGGLIAFKELCPNTPVYLRENALGRYFHGEKYIGADEGVSKLSNLRFTGTSPERIFDGFTLFSGIDGRTLWPNGNTELFEKTESGFIQDEFSHEQCLAVCENGEVTLFSGCAHNGIINILSRYRELFGSYPQRAVSGFHMIKKTPYTDSDVGDIRKTAEFLAKLPTRFYTGHCTGDFAFDIMKEILKDKLARLRVGDSV